MNCVCCEGKHAGSACSAIWGVFLARGTKDANYPSMQSGKVVKTCSSSSSLSYSYFRFRLREKLKTLPCIYVLMMFLRVSQVHI